MEDKQQFFKKLKELSIPVHTYSQVSLHTLDQTQVLHKTIPISADNATSFSSYELQIMYIC